MVLVPYSTRWMITGPGRLSLIRAVLFCLKKLLLQTASKRPNSDEKLFLIFKVLSEISKMKS